MTPLAWSFLLSAIGIVGILLAGSKRKVGWVVGFFVQPLWIIFAVTTEQYGFILNAVIYAAVYGRNWILWRRDERIEREAATTVLRALSDGGPLPPHPKERRTAPPTAGPKGPAGNSGAASRYFGGGR
jgi:nicotinamide riboside transporter PnuC